MDCLNSVSNLQFGCMVKPNSKKGFFTKKIPYEKLPYKDLSGGTGTKSSILSTYIRKIADKLLSSFS